VSLLLKCPSPFISNYILICIDMTTSQLEEQWNLSQTSGGALDEAAPPARCILWEMQNLS
jgi:hypothetical protein